MIELHASRDPEWPPPERPLVVDGNERRHVCDGCDLAEVLEPAIGPIDGRLAVLADLGDARADLELIGAPQLGQLPDAIAI